MLNNILADIANKIGNAGLLAPLMALLAGFLTSLTPCSLSSIPLIIGYVQGSGKKHDKPFLLALIFALGMSITFVGIGLVSGLLGRLVGLMPGYLYIVLGVFLILMAIQTWGIYYFVKPTTFINKSKSKSYLGALISGLLAGFFASPCTTPVTLALVTLSISGNGPKLWGLLLFGFFAIGHSLISILAGTFSQAAIEMTMKKGYKTLSKVIEILLGAFIFGLGIYFISLGL